MFGVCDDDACSWSVCGQHTGEDKDVWERADTSGRLILWERTAQEKHPEHSAGPAPVRPAL